ncbi:hypothetical protein AMECASPLE_029165, partial [Ameca splendens]
MKVWKHFNLQFGFKVENQAARDNGHNLSSNSGCSVPHPSEETSEPEQLLSLSWPSISRTEMISDLFPSAGWSPASPATGCERSSGFSMKFDPTPSDPLVQSQWQSGEASLRSSHRLDDVSCQSVSSSYSPPPLYSFFGHHTLTPPRNFLHPSPPGFCGSSSSSSDWCDPEQRECASCGTNSALLWRRDAAGKHLCYTCSLGQENGNSNQNEPLLRPKRRA